MHISFELLAGFFTAVSVFPYARGILKGEITPNQVSWGIWSFLGMVFFLTTYTQPNVPFASLIFVAMMVINPTIILLLSFYKGIASKVNTLEIFALLTAIVAMYLWYNTPDKASLLPISLAIVADFSALVPTLYFVYKHPEQDKPLMWFLFLLGASFTLLAITHHSIQNSILPVYILMGVGFVIFPLVRYRIQKNIPLKEWL